MQHLCKKYFRITANTHVEISGFQSGLWTTKILVIHHISTFMKITVPENTCRCGESVRFLWSIKLTENHISPTIHFYTVYICSDSELFLSHISATPFYHFLYHSIDSLPIFFCLGSKFVTWCLQLEVVINRDRVFHVSVGQFENFSRCIHILNLLCLISIIWQVTHIKVYLIFISYMHLQLL